MGNEKANFECQKCYNHYVIYAVKLIGFTLPMSLSKIIFKFLYMFKFKKNQKCIVNHCYFNI